MAGKISIAAFVFTTALLAGFFFSFTNPTMMAFAKVTPETYVIAMQEINRAVRNGVFLALFAGSPLLGIAASIITRNNWVILGALFAISSIFLTQMENVPMNRLMETWAIDNLPPASEIETLRSDWQWFNTIRTCTSAIGAGLGLIALISCTGEKINNKWSQPAL